MRQAVFYLRPLYKHIFLAKEVNIKYAIQTSEIELSAESY